MTLETYTSAPSSADLLGKIGLFEEDSFVLRAQKMRSIQSDLIAASSSPAAKLRRGFRPNSRPAIVKIIPKGGCKTAAQLREQFSYLTRKDTEDEVELIDSDLATAGPLAAEAQKKLIKEWTSDFGRYSKHGATTHLVVSLPNDTPHDLAKASLLEFASEVFASGRFGDKWDHVSAFHTDNENGNPHLHIVVRNKGIENERWFSIRKETGIPLHAIRQVQVECADRYGIDLHTAPRWETGITSRSPTTAEYWRAREEGREPNPPEMSGERAVALVQAVHRGISDYRHLARIANKEGLENSAENLRKFADSLATGQHSGKFDIGDDPGAFRRALLSVEKNFRKTPLMSQDHVHRAAGDALLAIASRSETDRSDVPDFSTGFFDIEARHSRSEAEGASLSPEISNAVRELTETTRNEICRLAEELGVEPDEQLARFSLDCAIPRHLADEWQRSTISRMGIKGNEAEHAYRYFIGEAKRILSASADEAAELLGIDKLPALVEPASVQPDSQKSVGADNAVEPAPPSPVEDPQPDYSPVSYEDLFSEPAPTSDAGEGASPDRSLSVEDPQPDYTPVSYEDLFRESSGKAEKPRSDPHRKIDDFGDIS